MKHFKNGYFFLFALLLIGVASLPFFQPSFFVIHDYTHVARIVEMADGLRAGHFPVQWSQNFGNGYGMPLFLFYGPFPFYLGALVTLLGVPAVAAMKFLFVLANILAFGGMYRLMQRWGRTAGLVAATAFLWAPYRALDIFVRGALSEVFALSLLPWILHWSFALAEKRRFSWLWLSLAVAALLLTHNLTALIALPFLFGFALVYLVLQRTDFWKRLFTLVAGYGTGVALSAFYVIPLFAEKSFTIVDEITSGYFDFHLHFLYVRQFFTATWGYTGSTYGPEDGISFHLGRVVLLLATAVTLLAVRQLLWWLRSEKRRSLASLVQHEKKSLLVGFTTLALGTSLFLTLGKSAWLWDQLPFLSYIQFPWRYLTVSTLFLAMLSGFWLSYIRSFFWRWTSMLLVVLLIVGTQFGYHQPAGYLENDEELYSSDPAKIRTQASDVLYDYLPKTFDRELLPVGPGQRIEVKETRVQNFTWVKNNPQELLISVESTPGATLLWNIADFPGWTYNVNSQEVKPTINESGLAEYQTSATLSSVGARFVPTQARQLGKSISVLALAGCVLVTVAQYKKRKHV